MALAQRRLNEDTQESELEEIRAAYPEFSRLLRARREELLPREHLARVNLDAQVMDAPGDDGDASVLDESADYFLHLANTHQHELIEIAEALDRIQRVSYGVCESCDNAIAMARLRNLPTARLCIDCKAAAERGVSHLRASADKPTL